MLGQQGTTSVLLVDVEFVVLDVVADVVEDAPVDAAHGGGGIEVTCGVVLFVDVLQIGWNGVVGSLEEFLLLHLKLLFPVILIESNIVAGLRNVLDDFDGVVDVIGVLQSNFCIVVVVDSVEQNDLLVDNNAR